VRDTRAENPKTIEPNESQHARADAGGFLLS
jgi:hypothetical protein